MQIPRGILIRIFLVAVLAGATAILFYLNQKISAPQTQFAEETAAQGRDFVNRMIAIDREVDTLLTHFGIDQNLVLKKEIHLPDGPARRFERKVAIPPDLLPIRLNQAFNQMAARYHGRAIASENIKENIVTIHIEIDGVVIQTLILKPTDARHMNQRGVSRRAA
jgi:hypothetical protein